MHPRATRCLVLLVVVISIAGCAMPASLPPEPSDAPLDAVPAPARTLDAPPTYVAGEWWRVTASFEPGIRTEEATLVMAGERDDVWLFGMPADAFSDFLVQFHFPPVGPVDKETLEYEVHGEMLRVLEFPLEVGATWETPFAGQVCTMSVLAAEGHKASLEMGGLCTWHALIDYDAQIGIPTRVALDNYGSFEVLDHGFGYAGRVLVPDEHIMEIFEARIGGVLHPVGPEPRPPVVEVELPEGYTDVSLLTLAGAFFVPSTPGQFTARVTLPDGTLIERMHAPTDGIGTDFDVVRIPAQAGTWRIELVALGGGAAIVEGFAWKALEIDVGG